VIRRVRRTFWGLVVVAVVATGALSRALAASPRPATGLTVAASALALTVSSLLALRILLVLATHERWHPRVAAGSAVTDRTQEGDEHGYQGSRVRDDG
jgi:hypothetical protein